MAPIAFTDAPGLHAFNSRDMGKYVQPQGDQPFSAQWWQARSKDDFDDPYTEKDTESQMYGDMLKGGTKDNPNENNVDDRKFYIFSQAYGPYTLQAGESAKIVMAYVAGHPGSDKEPGYTDLGPFGCVGRNKDPGIQNPGRASGL